MCGGGGGRGEEGSTSGSESGQNWKQSIDFILQLHGWRFYERIRKRLCVLLCNSDLAISSTVCGLKPITDT